jgi:dihydrofolate reductase
MSRFRFQITMTLDGYIAGPNQSLENPLGEGGLPIHEWVFNLKTFRELHGDPGGGETDVNDDVLREAATNVGATIMGRNMFGGYPGAWAADNPWKGWWGDTPPFHTPVYVMTHYPRQPLVMEGGTTFFFVTDGIEAALRQARETAGGKDVALGGGANVFQQYFAAGLLDEVELHIVPLLLGGGERLFADGAANVMLEQIRVIEGRGVTHVKYRAVN